MPRTLIAIATYNEVDGIGQLLSSIQEHAPEVSILVVDDNSPDGTGYLLDQLKNDLPSLTVIHRPRRLGLGSAHKLFFDYALDSGFDELVTMDADFSHHPKYLPELLSLLKKNEFVIASRFILGGKCDYGPIRLGISVIANTLARHLLNLRQREVTTSFRGFKQSLLQKLCQQSFQSEHYSFFFETSFRVSMLTDLIAEFPIHFEDRRAGQSKISKFEILRASWILLKLFCERVSAPLRTAPKVAPINPTEKSELCGICGCKYFSIIYAQKSASGPSNSAHTFSCTGAEHGAHGPIVKCLGCGIKYTNPQPRDLGEFYKNVEDPIYIENIPGREKTFFYSYRRISRFFRSGLRLLDVGSYCGTFLDIAKKHGHITKGIEPSIWASNYAAKHYNADVFCGNLSDYNGAETPFDVVTSWDVLEHVANPLDFLKDINRNLTKGGVFAFSTLDIENWWPRLLGERWPWYLEMHIWYFDQASLKLILEATGFQVASIESYRHVISLNYLISKLEKLGVPGVTAVAYLVGQDTLNKFFVPFSFGDIKLFHCIKISDVTNAQATIPNPLDFRIVHNAR